MQEPALRVRAPRDLASERHAPRSAGRARGHGAPRASGGRMGKTRNSRRMSQNPSSPPRTTAADRLRRGWLTRARACPAAAPGALSSGSRSDRSQADDVGGRDRPGDDGDVVQPTLNAVLYPGLVREPRRLEVIGRARARGSATTGAPAQQLEPFSPARRRSRAPWRPRSDRARAEADHPLRRPTRPRIGTRGPSPRESSVRRAGRRLVVGSGRHRRRGLASKPRPSLAPSRASGATHATRPSLRFA